MIAPESMFLVAKPLHYHSPDAGYHSCVTLHLETEVLCIMQTFFLLSMIGPTGNL